MSALTFPAAAERPFDLLAYGDPNVDYVFAADRVPEADEKVLGRSLGVFPGGTVGNVACAGGRLGLRVASYGRVGRDNDGRLLIASNTDFGVSNHHLIAVDHPTAAAMIMVNAAGEKALVYAPMPGAALDETRLKAALAQSRVVYSMPYDLEEFQHVASLARAAGCRVAIDIEAAVAPDRERLAALLACADVVFMNEGGYRATSPGAVTPDAVARLLEYGPALIAVTLGDKGAIACMRSERVTQAAFPAELVDATGAGDCFNGAFLSAILSDRSLAEALRIASAAASISISAVGARSALPSPQQVADLLATS